MIWQCLNEREDARQYRSRQLFHAGRVGF